MIIEELKKNIETAEAEIKAIDLDVIRLRKLIAEKEGGIEVQENNIAQKERYLIALKDAIDKLGK